MALPFNSSAICTRKEEVLVSGYKLYPPYFYTQFTLVQLYNIYIAHNWPVGIPLIRTNKAPFWALLKALTCAQARCFVPSTYG